MARACKDVGARAEASARQLLLQSEGAVACVSAASYAALVLPGNTRLLHLMDNEL